MAGVKDTNLGLIVLVQGCICACLKEGMCSGNGGENSSEKSLENKGLLLAGCKE